MYMIYPWHHQTCTFIVAPMPHIQTVIGHNPTFKTVGDETNAEWALVDNGEFFDIMCMQPRNKNVEREIPYLPCCCPPWLKAYPCIFMYTVNSVGNRKEGSIFTKQISIIRVMKKWKTRRCINIISPRPSTFSGLHEFCLMKTIRKISRHSQQYWYSEEMNRIFRASANKKITTQPLWHR